MSACDSCRDPGHCCRAFNLNRHFKPEQTREEVQELIADGVDGFGNPCESVPFEPLIRGWFYGEEGATEPYSVMWTFSCPMLGDDGRCTIYEDRPQICRNYEPKRDMICIEFEPKPEDIEAYEKKGEDDEA